MVAGWPVHVFVLASGVLSGPARAAPDTFDVAPAAPSWVVARPTPSAGPLAGERADLRYLLADDQVRVGKDAVEHYTHVVEQVISTAGVQDLTELRFTFDPSVEHLTLHHIRVLRPDRALDVLRPDALKTVHRERDLDRQIFNGEISVIAILEDIRIGDVLDFAWTVRGSNPALDGHYADNFATGFSSPVANLRLRVLWPAARPLYIQRLGAAPEPTVADAGDLTEYNWAQEATPAIVRDWDTPSWDDQTPRVLLSDFQGWDDVVRWALPNFRYAEPGPELSAAVRQWTAQSTDPEERALAALRFVQDDVRYLGIEMGPRGLIPHDANVVYSRRFGDCKDKTMLLVTALRAMGIQADPALVSTVRRGTVRDLQPTPFAFNHAITRVMLDGEAIWVDATRSLERGPLRSRDVPRYGFALVLAPGSVDLTPILASADPPPRSEVLERFLVEDLRKPVRLDVTTTFRGTEAARIRERFQRESVASIGKTYLDFYTDRYDGVTARAAPVLVDDATSGEVRVDERYELPHFWQDGRFALSAWNLFELLPKPGGLERTRPLAWDHTQHAAHTVEVVLPVDLRLDPSTTQVKTDAFDVEVRRTYADRVLTIAARYRNRADEVPAANLAQHREAVSSARDALYFELDPAMIDPGLDTGGQVTLLFGAVIGTFLLGRVGLEGVRRTRVSFAQRALAHKGGDTIATAILVESTHSAFALFQHLRCPCGASFDPLRRRTSDEYEKGRSYLHIALSCPKCGLETARYFKFRT